MRKPYFLQFAVMLMALGAAAVLIMGIKAFITPSGGLAPDKKGVFALEVAAFFMVLAAIMFKEALRGASYLMQGQQKRGRPKYAGLTFYDVGLVLFTLWGSVSVALAIIYVFGLS